ncbi:hypothetical protein [Desulfosporosinus sp. SB140]|uniref:hypothetical protein n=1 Tax=Desulfosporosinus paludis TaxID=3115649 RepID=UPI00388E0C4A
MRIIVTEDYRELSRWAAQFVAGLIRGKGNCILGLPTGSTPIGMYAELVKMHHDGLNMQDVHTFNLDEYVGLSPSTRRVIIISCGKIYLNMSISPLINPLYRMAWLRICPWNVNIMKG